MMKVLLIFLASVTQLVYVWGKNCMVQQGDSSEYSILCFDGANSKTKAKSQCKNLSFLPIANVTDLPGDFDGWYSWFQENTAVKNQINEISKVFNSNLNSLILEQSKQFEELKSGINSYLDNFIKVISNYTNQGKDSNLRSISKTIEHFRDNSISFINKIQSDSNVSISDCVEKTSVYFQTMITDSTCVSNVIQTHLSNLDHTNNLLISRLKSLNDIISDLNTSLALFPELKKLNTTFEFDLKYLNFLTIFKQSYNEALVSKRLQSLLDNCNSIIK